MAYILTDLNSAIFSSEAKRLKRFHDSQLYGQNEQEVEREMQEVSIVYNK